MELLRCFAMLLVCLFHIDFISYNFPESQLNINTQPLEAFIKLLATSATFTCVDVFVLLSGWYGIHFKKRRLAEFIFQVLIFSISIYAFMLLLDDNVKFRWQSLVHIFMTDDYWFVPVYLSLYVFSPVLNSFIEKSDKKTMAFVVVVILLLQSVFGWLSPNEEGYLEGRSPFSFFILYMLARYVHIHADNIKRISKKGLAVIFTIIICVQALLTFFLYKHGQQVMIDTIFKFSSLFTISAALCIVLFFYHLKIRSKAINWIGKSAFAVFLLHCFPYFNQDVYQKVLRDIYIHNSGITYTVYVTIFITLIYFGAVFLDQIRIFIWNRIIK